MDAAGLPKLLPCPFCGGEAHEIDCGHEGTAIECMGCQAGTKVRYRRGAAQIEWNTRAMRAAQAAPPRERIMRALFEAHRGQWGYSRFHESAEVREKAQRNWDTLRDRKPEEWADLEREADAVLAEWDAAPSAPAEAVTQLDRDRARKYGHASPFDAPMADRPSREALEALRNYKQADDDGVMVLVSRQAIDEAIAYLSQPSPAETPGAMEALREAVIDALGNLNAAINQVCDKDDKIIVGHMVEAGKTLAKGLTTARGEQNG